MLMTGGPAGLPCLTCIPSTSSSGSDLETLHLLHTTANRCQARTNAILRGGQHLFLSKVTPVMQLAYIKQQA